MSNSVLCARTTIAFMALLEVGIVFLWARYGKALPKGHTGKMAAWMGAVISVFLIPPLQAMTYGKISHTVPKTDVFVSILLFSQSMIALLIGLYLDLRRNTKQL